MVKARPSGGHGSWVRGGMGPSAYDLGLGKVQEAERVCFPRLPHKGKET